MMWLSIVVALVLLSFGGVLFFGAPYVPTLTPQVKAALDLAALEAGETMLELGCGDGKVLIAAAKQGINVVGYEINPLLVAVAWLRTRRYRRQVRIIWGNFWRKSWPEAEAIFTFLMPKYMSRLDKKVMQYKTGPVKLVSFAFKVPGKKVAAEKSGVYLYTYQ